MTRISSLDTHRYVHAAMATEFEIVVAGVGARVAAGAAAAAFERLDALDRELSRFVPHSDVARIARLPPGASIRLSPDAFDCLALARQIREETGGAFDPAVGGLADLWREAAARGRAPTRAAIAAARRAAERLKRLALDADRMTVRAPAGGVAIDLGAIGKGWAIDAMGAVLRDHGIARALLHAGRSSVLALDGPAGSAGWPVELRHPDDPDRLLASFRLRRAALGASGLAKGPHIIDPRAGRPVAWERFVPTSPSSRWQATSGQPRSFPTHTIAAWALAPTAARADALSTAFMVLDPGEVRRFCRRHPDVRALLVPSPPRVGGVCHDFAP